MSPKTAPKKRKAETRVNAGLDPVKTETKKGRPTLYTDQVADRICQLIASSSRGLDFICETNPDLPKPWTIHKWLRDKLAFSQKYVQARELQAELLFDECLEIADDSSRDTKLVGRDGQEIEVPDTEWISRSKLRVDTRLRIAGKLHPRKYGDKLDVTTNGNPIPAPVIQVMPPSGKEGA